MNDFLNKWKYYIFFILLVALYFAIDYQSILFYRPQGFHFIRQTDSLSFVANYFKNGFNFFEPQVFNLNSIDGKAACEFPILYYITALFYLVFNEQEFILRLITIIIVSYGFFSLFKLLNLILEDVLYALIFTFLFLSSTVLLYYTNNFLPDASALGLTLIAWYYAYLFLFNRNKKRLLILSFLFFTLSSLLKVTFFINPIALILTILIYDFLEKGNISRILKRNIPLLIVFAISATMVLSWNLFAIHYNEINKDVYFLLNIRPIWDLNKLQIIEIWDYMSNYWFSKYYFQSTLHFFLIVSIIGLVFIKNSRKIILIPSILLLIGSLVYWALYFSQFKDHDYYFIAFIPAIVFIVINSFTAIRNKFPQLLNNYTAKLLLLILCILSINYARLKLAERYSHNNDELAKIGTLLSDTRSYIDLLGISENAKVIIFADETPNGGLYFINRNGWNVGDTGEEGINKINEYAGWGAEYLVNTTDINFDFRYQKIGEFEGVIIYKIE